MSNFQLRNYEGYFNRRIDKTFALLSPSFLKTLIIKSTGRDLEAKSFINSNCCAKICSTFSFFHRFGLLDLDLRLKLILTADNGMIVPQMYINHCTTCFANFLYYSTQMDTLSHSQILFLLRTVGTLNICISHLHLARIKGDEMVRDERHHLNLYTKSRPGQHTLMAHRPITDRPLYIMNCQSQSPYQN